MDETLSRLLEAELRSEQLVEEAKARREQGTREALEEARAAEQRFAAHIPEIHDAFRDKAVARAEQTLAELERRYDERKKALREMAEAHEDDAVEAVFALLVDPGAS